MIPDEIIELQANGWAVVGTAPPPEEEKTYAMLNGDREIFTPAAMEWKPEPRRLTSDEFEAFHHEPTS